MGSADTLERSAEPPVLTEDVNIRVLISDPAVGLHPVLSCLPGWELASPKDLEISQISGAMTNLVYRCRLKRTQKHVLARIFGGGNVLFKRSTEQAIFAALAEAGIGPKLLASFGNGRLEEFLFDASISPDVMRSDRVSVCIAAAMAAFHYTRLDGLQLTEEATIWDRCRDWAARVSTLYAGEELDHLGLSNVLDEIQALERTIVQKHPKWLGFCHNDLQYGNMMLHAAHASSLHLDSGTGVDLPSIEAKLASTSLNQRQWERASRSVHRESGQVHGPRGASPDGVSPSRRMKRGESFQTDDLFVDSFDDAVPDTIDESEDGVANNGSVSSPSTASQLRGDEQASPAQQSPCSTGWQSPPRTAFYDAANEPFRSSSRASFSSLAHAGRGSGPLSVRFIDYEYAGMNHVAFDMANHWIEYAADYHTDQPHVLDFSKLPNEAHQGLFVRAYVQAAMMLKVKKDDLHLLPGYSLSEDAGLLQDLAKQTSPSSFLSEAGLGGDAGIEEAAKKLQEAAQDYMVMSHLVWGLWGLIQLKVSDVADFDFYSYALQRLQQYQELKAKLLRPSSD